MLSFFENRENDILFEEDTQVAHIIFNNAENLNVLFFSFYSRVLSQLKVWEESVNINLIVIRSTSNRVVSAGGNIKRFIDFRNKGEDNEVCHFTANAAYELMNLFPKMTKPIITILDGLAMGGGIMLPSLGTFRIVTENTIVATPETKIGTFVDSGATYILSHMDRQIGVYMALTAATLCAEDTIFSGIGTHFVSSSKCETLIKELSEIEDFSVTSINDVIEKFTVCVDHVPKSYTLHGKKIKTIESCFKYDTVEEILTALEKDGSDFALKSRKEILKRCPTSLKLSLELLRRSSTNTLTSCLETERCLWDIMTLRDDFLEGYLASFIEKRDPKWIPSKIEDVKSKNIEDIFHQVDLLKPHFEHLWNGICIGPDNRYTLPHNDEITMRLMQFKYNKQRTLEWFTSIYKNKYGVQQKVKDVLELKNQSTEISSKL